MRRPSYPSSSLPPFSRTRFCVSVRTAVHGDRRRRLSGGPRSLALRCTTAVRSRRRPPPPCQPPAHGPHALRAAPARPARPVFMAHRRAPPPEPGSVWGALFLGQGVLPPSPHRPVDALLGVPELGRRTRRAEAAGGTRLVDAAVRTSAVAGEVWGVGAGVEGSVVVVRGTSRTQVCRTVCQ